MKKIRITTNRGKVFDWLINNWINFKLWWSGIDDDVDLATKVAAKELRRFQ